jgi:hypothetical protein
MHFSKKDIEMFVTLWNRKEFAGFYIAKTFPEDGIYVEYQKKLASKELPE